MVKGVLTAEDGKQRTIFLSIEGPGQRYNFVYRNTFYFGTAARIAVQAGAAGIIVSNHGARQLDYVPATIMALEEVSNLFLSLLILVLVPVASSVLSDLCLFESLYILPDAHRFHVTI